MRQWAPAASNRAGPAADSGSADAAEHPAQRACREADAALAAGDLVTAQRRLERACRLAPQNPVPVVSLAAVLLQQRAPGAARLFARIAQEHDLREAWLGLAAARRLDGDPDGAAAALAQALARGAPSPDLAFVEAATAITRDVGAVGWAGLHSNGRMVVALVGNGAAPGRLVITLDGVRVTLTHRTRRRDGMVCLVSGRLPDTFATAQRLEVKLGGGALLGSPIVIPAITRVEGFVEATDAGLAGWVWRPGDPEADVHLSVGPADDAANMFDVHAALPQAVAATQAPFARPRGFVVPAARLVGGSAVRVIGPGGRDLLGSPLDRGAEQRSVAAPVRRDLTAGVDNHAVPAAYPGDAPGQTTSRGGRARATRLPTSSAAVVMPVYRGRDVTLAALAAVVETVGPDTPVIVVDDATPEPALAEALDGLAATGRIRLLRHTRNRGFPAAVNTGIRAAAGRDVVLLNSDTLVAGNWIQRLRTAAYAAPEVATATPLSNNATILSYPDVARPNPAPGLEETCQLDALAAAANGEGVVEIPTAVGFCMYVRRDCLDEVGLLREDVFAQGYGEENDFCRRAHRRGWRHVAATGVFVAHLGGQSFGAAPDLVARNLRSLNRLHPGYDQLIRDFVADDPLASARKRLDVARWEADRDGRRAVVIITHDRGGGVERHVRTRCEEIERAGRRPIVVRPSRSGTTPGCRLSRGVEDAHPNLVYQLPAEVDSLAELLRQERPTHVELHHGMDHQGAALELDTRLGVPLEVRLHDYALVCPRVTLVDTTRRYCGEPDLPTCENCVADDGRQKEDSVAALRARSAALLRRAARAVAPSGDAARRFARYFPDLPRATVQAWAREEQVSPRAAAHPQAGSHAHTRVCVVGAISADKGYDVLLAAAGDAAERRLPLEFVVVGHTCDDERLQATGRAWVTGEFAAAEAEELIRAQAADFAWLPSIWPETWCYALGDAWQAGLHVVAFDVGAPAERIRATGRGWLLPLGMPTAALNDALLRRAQTMAVDYADAPSLARAATV